MLKLIYLGVTCFAVGWATREIQLSVTAWAKARVENPNFYKDLRK